MMSRGPNLHSVLFYFAEVLLLLDEVLSAAADVKTLVSNEQGLHIKAYHHLLWLLTNSPKHFHKVFWVLHEGVCSTSQWGDQFCDVFWQVVCGWSDTCHNEPQGNIWFVDLGEPIQLALGFSHLPSSVGTSSSCSNSLTSLRTSLSLAGVGSFFTFP